MYLILYLLSSVRGCYNLWLYNHDNAKAWLIQKCSEVSLYDTNAWIRFDNCNLHCLSLCLSTLMAQLKIKMIGVLCLVCLDTLLFDNLTETLNEYKIK